MQPIELEYSRTFNLGDYESEKITVKVSVDVTENPIDVFKDTKALAFSMHKEGKLLEESKKVVDAATEELEKHAPKDEEKPTETQFNAPNWTQKEGSKGVYEQAQNDGSENFKIVSQYVKAHSGFCNLYGFKVWLHNQDENTIDRRR
ncbi:MAG: hypothetical protein D4S01_10355 [Dehalococcoidia bacterium]|nr:MAG: hypothetical protein D4S01_10355 [Dehalococcoidia bacterium]